MDSRNDSKKGEPVDLDQFWTRTCRVQNTVFFWDYDPTGSSLVHCKLYSVYPRARHLDLGATLG